VIYYVLPKHSRFTMDEFFSFEQPAFVNRFRVIDFGQLPAMRRFERGTYVIAGIDQAIPAMKELIASLCEQLEAAGGSRILNQPLRTLGRFELLKRLHAAGKSDVRVARVNENLESLRYPVFVRSEREHGGNLSALAATPAEARKAIGATILRGHAASDLMVVEFCSTADSHGVFRKYAAYNVGGRILGRSLNAGRQWMLKLETSDFTRELVVEDQRYVMDNPHAEQLAELFAFANIDFGQIDYSIKDGRIQPWEINVNPTIGRGVKPGRGLGPPELAPIRNETREFFFDRFRSAWIDLDSLPADGPPVDVEFDRATVEAAMRERRTGGRLRRIARGLLQPLKPVLKPVASRLLGQLARRGSAASS
jgi:hypothetical protein